MASYYLFGIFKPFLTMSLIKYITVTVNLILFHANKIVKIYYFANIVSFVMLKIIRIWSNKSN
jgi:hypothetical protein